METPFFLGVPEPYFRSNDNRFASRTSILFNCLGFGVITPLPPVGDLYISPASFAEVIPMRVEAGTLVEKNSQFYPPAFPNEQ